MVRRPAAALVTHAWWMLLLTLLALQAVATLRRVERVERLTALPPWSVDAPARDTTSPTGLAHGQRRLIVPGHHQPSYWWITEAQQAVEHGRLRVRTVGYDAAPDGREIRRTVPYRAWLVATGWIHATLAGGRPGPAIERAVLWADPLLLALLLAGGAAYAARYLGPAAAAGLVLAGGALFPLAANFPPGAPDPRALAWVLALGSVLPLLVPGRVGVLRRRIHFAVAGVAGGLGMWNDAPTQAPLLLALALGGVGCELIRGRAAGATAPDPLPWRTWAGVGAAVTLLASGFEYGAEAFTGPLEAVHAAHAFTWWGAGELLSALARWWSNGRPALDRPAIIRVAVAAVALLAWPVAGWITGSGGLLAADFHARELANHPAGGIATHLRAWIDGTGATGAKWATLLPLGLIAIAGVRVVRGCGERETRAGLGFVTMATALPLVLALFQLRWWNLVDVLLLPLMALLAAEALERSRREVLRLGGAALLLLPGLVVAFPSKTDVNAAVTAAEAQALVARDFAWWLNQRRGADPIVLYSTPVFSGAAAFHGGFRVVTSSDGDNTEGQLTAVRIASASTEQEIAVLLRTRGITHVALPLWDPVLDQLVRLGRNLPADAPLPQDAFAVALRWWEIPLWMRPMDYLIPSEPPFEGFELRAFALQPEQAPEMGLSRLADFFVERGQLEEAGMLRESLQAYPRSPVALGAVAQISLALRDGPALERALEALIPHLSRRSTRDLPADRRISLAMLFQQTRRTDLARQQLAAGLAELDAATLRTLTPGSVIHLVVLSRELDVPFPNPELESVALGLIPPRVRSALGQ